MKRIVLLFFSAMVSIWAEAQQWETPFESSGGKESATYQEAIRYYERLGRNFRTVHMEEAGPTDAVYPLHVVYYSSDGHFDLRRWKQQGKVIILINNGIHPGEPDGIDASMMLLRDAAMGRLHIPEQVVLAVVPVFNIGGALNRGSYSRANQNGPNAYGFRGNAQNLDLNRDFIKMDAAETRSLVGLFHRLDPDIFIDNHVSNGADYQHVMTLLSVNPDKQGHYLGQFLKDELEPAIYTAMKKRGYDLVPYVNHWGHTPDKGWQQFYDPPRFASGFAALFGTFAFVPETHMLKPFDQRVAATRALMECFIAYAGARGRELRGVRQEEAAWLRMQQELVLDWRVDTTRSTPITFKGYEGKYKPSEVSGQPRLYYDRNKPYTQQVPFYNIYQPAARATVPRAYVIPQGWGRVISRLKRNGVQMRRLQRDTTLDVTVYRFTGMETSPRAYEGHYRHTNVQYTKRKETVRLMKGDYIITTEQRAKRYLVETLEPNAPDAFFAWGFFDAILQQKEYFSDYVFEDEAAALLRRDPGLRKELEDRKRGDEQFAQDGQAQLDFIYRRSAYYEPGHMRYPVFRID